MKNVYKYISESKDQFTQENFYKNFRNADEKIIVPVCAMGLGFWIMTFQDALRLNAQKFQDQKLKLIAEKHRNEDSGHDLWYLHDLDALRINPPDLYMLYSPDLAFVRDSAFEVMGEIMKSDDDYTRLAIIETIEAVSEVFFYHMATYTSSKANGFKLLYFSRHHYEAEMSHSDRDIEAAFMNNTVSYEKRRQIIETVDRILDSFRAVLEGLNDMVMHQEQPRPLELASPYVLANCG
ncbi:hypothetical protein [Hahella sp. CCB-MM4]|uniref:hypothetical protein n=1 Tax=Hahella sp. (strain CCB-MM4) TaxID=1926491 RepID=UPI0011408590|nr:hypothetical protein [Hahella sp. CCB-MM4]